MNEQAKAVVHGVSLVVVFWKSGPRRQEIWRKVLKSGNDGTKAFLAVLI